MLSFSKIGVIWISLELMDVKNCDFLGEDLHIAYF